MAFSLCPQIKFRYEDDNGDNLSGGLVYTYTAGSTSPIDTYTDATGGTTNANPVVLDARGEANIWLDTTKAYKFVVKDSLGTTIDTIDNITPSDGDGAVTADKFKLSSTDPVSDYFLNKITFGDGITGTTTTNPSGDTLELSSTIAVSGTENYIPIFGASNALGDSAVYVDTGSLVSEYPQLYVSTDYSGGTFGEVESTATATRLYFQRDLTADKYINFVIDDTTGIQSYLKFNSAVYDLKVNDTEIKESLDAFDTYVERKVNTNGYSKYITASGTDLLDEYITAYGASYNLHLEDGSAYITLDDIPISSNANITTTANATANYGYLERLYTDNIYAKDGSIIVTQNDMDFNTSWIRSYGALGAQADRVLIQISGETYSRLIIKEDGGLAFGGGSAVEDTLLDRTSAGVLGLTGALTASDYIEANQIYSALYIAATPDIDWDNGMNQFLSASGAKTFTFTNGKSGAGYTLFIDATSGAETYTWPVSVDWLGAPFTGPSGSAVYMVQFKLIGSTYYGSWSSNSDSGNLTVSDLIVTGTESVNTIQAYSGSTVTFEDDIVLGTGYDLTMSATGTIKTDTIDDVSGGGIVVSSSTIMADVDFDLVANTADGSDDQYVGMSGGGGYGPSRGGSVRFFGNEEPSYPGSIRVDIGNVAGSEFVLRAVGVDRFKMNANGTFDVNKTMTFNSGADLIVTDDIKVSTGDYYHNSVQGFTGTGAYTNFTISGGIITGAT